MKSYLFELSDDESEEFLSKNDYEIKEIEEDVDDYCKKYVIN